MLSLILSPNLMVNCPTDFPPGRVGSVVCIEVFWRSAFLDVRLNLHAGSPRFGRDLWLRRSCIAVLASVLSAAVHVELPYAY